MLGHKLFISFPPRLGDTREEESEKTEELEDREASSKEDNF